MKIVFWLAICLVIYPYFVYPLLLRALSRWWPWRGTGSAPPSQPRCVTVVVSAHNEARVIEEKIRSTLATNYPDELLSIVVVSDASTDATNDIVRRISERQPSVRLLEFEEHQGKTEGINRAMDAIDTDIVVFTDANAMFDAEAVSELVRCFDEEDVGYVVGMASYERGEDIGAGSNEGLYWRHELKIKELESAFDSVVGGDGAIYAIRRELYQPLAAEDINDFVNPLQIIARGYRGVFQVKARAYEDPANDYVKEFQRKRRIVCRSWGALLRYGSSLNLKRRPRFLFMLASHKVIRWFTALWLFMALVANVAVVISDAAAVYILSLLAFAAVFAASAIGWRQSSLKKPVGGAFSIPYYFLGSNIAAFLGIIDYARGNRYVTWKHARLNGSAT